mgnify:CR=1 FL=1
MALGYHFSSTCDTTFLLHRKHAAAQMTRFARMAFRHFLPCTVNCPVGTYAPRSGSSASTNFSEPSVGACWACTSGYYAGSCCMCAWDTTHTTPAADDHCPWGFSFLARAAQLSASLGLAPQWARRRAVSMWLLTVASAWMLSPHIPIQTYMPWPAPISGEDLTAAKQL